MKNRILNFLQSENKSYAQFAEEIGVQPSGISHILSGRNNPSLDFVMKMLDRYDFLSTDWLLFGRGEMYRYTAQPTLFDVEPVNSAQDDSQHEVAPEPRPGTLPGPEERETGPASKKLSGDLTSVSEKRLEKVLLFYSDKTFTEYLPS
ncbi:MAG: helix-turn-helix transcriptional regulator [Bacteroidales bacterium]|nr:helix-turn-helix transcriptional regulator [Bacteroidales bacterium]MDT8372995.1 helix-turn-helix transcriptional regulator [Bacteroidales bacterium]